MVTRLDVFDKLAVDLYAEYPTIKVKSKRNLSSESLPCVWANEIDSYDITSRNLDNSDKVRISQFEIQVFSKELEELYKIVQTCKKSMEEMMFQCSASQDIDNAEDVTISRHVMRFHRTICGGDEL